MMCMLLLLFHNNLEKKIHAYSWLRSCYFESVSGLMSDCSLIVIMFLKMIE